MHEEPKSSIKDDFLQEDFEIEQEELETFIEHAWLYCVLDSFCSNSSLLILLIVTVVRSLVIGEVFPFEVNCYTLEYD